MQFESVDQYLDQLNQHVYGLVDDKIERLRVLIVRVEKSIEGIKIEYHVQTDATPPSKFTVNPAHVFASVNELLTQMAADYQARTKKTKKQ